MMVLFNIYLICVSLYVYLAISGMQNRMYSTGSSKRDKNLGYRCGNDLCECIDDTTLCDGDKNLTFIPKLPSSITSLTFVSNNLPFIDANTFKNVSDLKLAYLKLVNNNIETISPDAFEYLSSLKTLILEAELNLRENEIADSFSSLDKSHIHCIWLIRMYGWNKIPGNMFDNLHTSNLKELKITDNVLDFIETKTFSGLKHLSILSLNSNGLEWLRMDTLKSLTVFTIAGNKFSYVPKFCSNKLEVYVPVLSSLDLSHNKIMFVRKKSFKCIPKLSTITLDGNPLTHIEGNSFSMLHSLDSLYMSSLYLNMPYKDSPPYISNTAFNSSTLRTFKYDNNTLQMVLHKYNPDFIFRYCPNLVNLTLSNTPLPVNKTLVNDIFRHLTRIQIIDASFSGLNFLPKVIFSKLKSLKVLDLSGNRISAWDGPNVLKESKMSTLSLRGNEISVINETSFPNEMLKHINNESLDLSNNPYTCTCQTLHSVKWFRKHEHILKDYPHNYKCFYPLEIRGHLLKDYNPSRESCKEKNIAMLVSVPVVVVLVSILCGLVLLYKCRWHLRYGIYLFRIRHKNYERMSDSDNFVYAGFVIYSDSDRSWVHNELIHRIEDQEGFRLCIRLRDFDVGKIHVDNIVDNMSVSGKIIVILSNNFANDEWCHFQLLLAETRLLNQNTDAFLVLMLEDISIDCLRSSLFKLVTERQYVFWSDEEAGNNLFWEQTVSQMKKSTVII